MGKNSKIEIVRTSENIKQADLYKKTGTNTFFICLNERYMNQIKEYSSPDNTYYDPQFFIKFSDSKVAELIGTFDCKLECSSDAFKIDYYCKKNISSGNYKDIPTVYMDSEILLLFDIPYNKFEEAKEYLRTHNNTVKISFVEEKEEKKEMGNLIGFKETKFDYNSITIEADIGIENFFINNDRLTDRFNEHDNRLMPTSIDLNLIIKDDKLVNKYLHVNKEAIVHNCDNNIPSTVKISRFAHMGNYNFILTIETAAMNYDMITNYINSHNGKFIITLNLTIFFSLHS